MADRVGFPPVESRTVAFIWIVFFAACTLLLYVGYRKLLPQPIPGIPHNKSAARSIFGDLPELMSYMARTQEIWPWVGEQNSRHQSPIVQVFGRPFSKPWLVISDHREASDILLRRTKEFDRADFTVSAFIGLTPDFHITFKSSDDRFKAHRNLLKDLMTPAFLHEVAAHQIYANNETFVKLWEHKAQVAQGHAFQADADIYNVALDVIFATTFGLEQKDSNVLSQLQQISSAHVALPQSSEEPVVFPHTSRPKEFEAIEILVESLATSIKAPLPRVAHWVLRQMPFMRKARADKEQLFTNMINASIRRVTSGKMEKRSALDDILLREQAAAKKEGRSPVYNSRTIYDELFGFIIGGHDTTATTLLWTVKHLALAQRAQSTLRAHLRAAFPHATAEKRNPSLDEILRTQVPYLDATIEEANRIAVIFNGSIRTTTIDTTVFGHRIPKGTEVFLMHNGPGYFEPPLPVGDSLRSQSSLNAKHQVGQWKPDAQDMKSFRPERWLVQNKETGNQEFNAQAGPSLAFGLGPRACYGRRLAYLQLRIIMIMMVWNFELQEMPASLSGWSAVTKLTRYPTQCYVRLEKANF